MPSSVDMRRFRVVLFSVFEGSSASANKNTRGVHIL